MLFSCVIEGGETRKWINHPLQRDMLLGIGPKDLKMIQWQDLVEVALFYYREKGINCSATSDLESEDAPTLTVGQSLDTNGGFIRDTYVSKVIRTQDGKHVLVQIIKLFRHGRNTKRLSILRNTSLESFNHTKVPIPLDLLDISNNVMAKADVPLGILPEGMLVFLDKDLWVCSLKLDWVRQPDALKRHYFLPREWAGAESLEQCCMLQDGTILWPVDGEVAVLSSRLGEGRW